MKGYPHDAQAMTCSEIAARGWNVLADDLSPPLAGDQAPRAGAQRRLAAGPGAAWGIDPGAAWQDDDVTLSCSSDGEAGAWGITFATVTQLRWAWPACAAR